MLAYLSLLLLISPAVANFDAAAQEAIVQAHNDLRSAIAQGNYVAQGVQKPTAADMRKIQWDSEVAESAQRFAEGCPDDHSHWPGLGENLYWKWNSEDLGDLGQYGVAASKSWEKEFQDYGWTSVNLDQASFDSGIGHATQMAWAETNLIGCGVKNCGPDATKDNMNKVAVVCQYKSAGNMIGSDIYKEGETCSSCPSSTSCETSSGLCA